MSDWYWVVEILPSHRNCHAPSAEPTVAHGSGTPERPLPHPHHSSHAAGHTRSAYQLPMEHPFLHRPRCAGQSSRGRPANRGDARLDGLAAAHTDAAPPVAANTQRQCPQPPKPRC